MNDGRRDLELFIAASPERVWSALTDPQQTRLYWYGALNHSRWTPGARWTSDSEDGTVWLDGEIVEADAPRRLVHTMHIAHDPGPATEAPSEVTFEITPMGESSRLVLTHTGLGPQSLEYVTGGWELILSGLKTLVETGQPLVIGSGSSM